MLKCLFLVVNLSTYPITTFDCKVAFNANKRCAELYGKGLRKLIKKDKLNYWAICKHRNSED